MDKGKRNNCQGKECRRDRDKKRTQKIAKGTQSKYKEHLGNYKTKCKDKKKKTRSQD